ncbi:cytochrome P450 [Gautieria morchelliformis]|nr:cytochrome P450 [Gautieria morchelliformis]
MTCTSSTTTMLNQGFDGLNAVFIILSIGLLSELHRWKRRGSAASNRPAIVPWWLPWLGNAIQYGKNPRRFLESCRRTYGSAFTTLLAGRKITFILEPSLISSMFRNSSDFVFAPLRAEVQEGAFATSREGSVHAAIEEQVYPNAFRHFSQSIMSETTSRYSKGILDAFQSMRHSSSARSIGLWNLVFSVSYKSSSRAIFGDSFPHESTLSDFTKFDEGFTLLASHLPAIFTRTYDAARARVITKLVQWTNADKSTGETRAGISPLVTQAVEAMRQAELGASDIATHLLSLLWATQANTMWTTFWFLAYVLQDQEHVRRLRQEIEDVLSARFAGSVDALIAAEPAALSSKDFILLESAFRETMRLSSGVILARQVSNDVTLHTSAGEPTRLVNGEVVFVTARNIHLNADVYEDPLSFRLDRFVSDDGMSLRHPTVNGRSLPYDLLAWGGGKHMCKGRFIAQYQTKIFAVLFLHLFDLRGSHVVARETGKLVRGRTLPEIDETCLGILHSNEDMVCHLDNR